MSSGTKYRDIVCDIALDQHGFVTTSDAVAAGVPPIELPKLAARGGMENIAYGVYRVTGIPPTSNDQFAEAIFRVGRESFLYGESVLALFGLADVNPRQIKVGVRRRARPRLPAFIELVQVKGETATTLYDGMRSQTVADAIMACRGRIETPRLMNAARYARKEGLLTTVEWKNVKDSLKQ
jgi:Predicted transcriptional regulator